MKDPEELEAAARKFDDAVIECSNALEANKPMDRAIIATCEAFCGLMAMVLRDEAKQKEKVK